MICITVFRDSAGDIKGFHVEGHAGYAEKGKDIVCSAVSALVQTAVMGLTDVAGIKVRHIQEEGWLSCIVPSDISLDKKEKANVILKTMIIGLKSIEKGYGGFISIEEKEV